MEIVTGAEMQTSLTWVGVCKPMIAERTAQDWLKKLNWRYEEKKSGMYIDGHEQEDVVEYQMCSLRTGRNMKHTSISGTTMAIPFLVPSALAFTLISFLSHMTN